MLTISLNDGTTVPWLAFGTGTTLTGKDASQLCSLALDRGFRHIDTAQLYGNEESVGRSIAARGLPRSSIYVTTKLKDLPVSEGATTVEEALRESLRKLQLDYVDLFLIHVPTFFDDRLEAIWAQMVEVKRKKLTKSIGVSNFNVKYLSRILATGLEVPVVNQVRGKISEKCTRMCAFMTPCKPKIEYHPFVHDNLEPLLALHAKYGIVTASFGGLSPILPSRAGREAKSPARARLAALLDKFAAARCGEGVIATRNQMLFKWLQHQGVIVVT